jgi:HlyD family secretion protein
VVIMIKAKQILKHGCIMVLAGIILSATACGTTKTIQATSVTNQIQEVQNNTIEAAGKIKANDIKNIILDFTAIVQDVHVKEGQRVKQGEELITLDIHEIKEQILDKENDLRIQKLQLEKSLGSNAYNEEKELSDLQTAQVEMRRVNEDLEIKQSLFESGAIAKDELENALRRVEDAEKKVADKHLSKADDYRLDIEIQQQRINALESDIKQLKDKLSRSYIKEDKIVSDINNGLVQEISRVAGDSIQANTKILNLVNMDSLIVVADVSEDFIKDVKVGAEVEILPLADSSKQYKGQVLKIADMGIEKNGETIIQIEISIDNVDEFIKPNFNVDVKISK